mmetsp:Transcript_97466/g.154212  ORF Transcript_97466/g.154212 Transcript_97466/m.154212 type:complete len:88 (+) Transcript_97466:81-344(+)
MVLMVLPSERRQWPLREAQHQRMDPMVPVLHTVQRHMQQEDMAFPVQLQGQHMRPPPQRRVLRQPMERQLLEDMAGPMSFQVQHILR